MHFNDPVYQGRSPSHSSLAITHTYVSLCVRAEVRYKVAEHWMTDLLFLTLNAPFDIEYYFSFSDWFES